MLIDGREVVLPLLRHELPVSNELLMYSTSVPNTFARKPREIKMEEKLKKRISTTFKLHGFSLRRSVIVTDNTLCGKYAVAFPFGFSNFTKIKLTK
jgi:hypothetical protein